MYGERGHGTDGLARSVSASGEAPIVAISIGNSQFLPGNGAIVENGESKRLLPMEVKLLLFFSSNPDADLDRDTISQAVWGYPNTGRTLDVHVSWLKRKLDEGRINSVRGVGYRYNSDDALSEDKKSS